MQIYLMPVSKEAVFILRKLYDWNRTGNKYVNKHDVLRAFPKRYRNTKLFKIWVKELRNRELIIMHKKGECISLNKHKLDEIEKVMDSV